MLWLLSPASAPRKGQTLLLREPGPRTLLLPPLPQSRQPLGTMGCCYQAAPASGRHRSLPTARTRDPLAPALLTHPAPTPREEATGTSAPVTTPYSHQ